jgi:hypothetical protein
MKYRSCSLIEACAMNFNGMINSDKPVISLCCEGISEQPAVAFADTPEKTLANFRRMCADVIEKSVASSLAESIGEDALPQKCSECVNFQLSDWGFLTE